VGFDFELNADFMTASLQSFIGYKVSMLALQSTHQVSDFKVLYKPLLATVTVLYQPIHLDELLALMNLGDQDRNPVLTENTMDACGVFLVL
jgi:hypothetical protein